MYLYEVSVCNLYEVLKFYINCNDYPYDEEDNWIIGIE